MATPTRRGASSPPIPARSSGAPNPDAPAAPGDGATSPDPRRWFGLAALAAGLSMIVLDGTIVGVALPQIITDLKLDLTDAQWVNSLYNVVFAALLLSFGRLGDRRGRRRIFLAGVVLFAAASVTAGFATDATSLIASRAVQGIGGAMVLPATLSTVNATFRGKERATAFGIWGAVMAGMAAIGPLLGGWLTTNVSWRWIFFVNVPIALVVVGLGLYAVRETSGDDQRPGMDVDGLLTSALGFGLLVFGFIEGTSLGWWVPLAELRVGPLVWPASAPISAAPVAIALGVIFLTLFVIWERHRAGNGRSAIIDLSLFRIGTFAWGNLTAMAVAVGEFALVFVLPLYLVNAAGLSVMQAGLVLAGMALGAFLSGASARHLAAALGAPRVVVLGLGLEVVGTAVTGLLVRAQAAPGWLTVALAVYGVGLGLASAQLTSTVLRDVPTAQSGMGSATQSTVRQVGAALGAALAGSTLAVRLGTVLADRLRELPGLPAGVAEGLSHATADSAGGAIVGLRAEGAHGRLGALGPDVVQALSDGFAAATSSAIWLACGFLLLGLIGSLRVARSSRDSSPGSEAAASERTDAVQPA